MRNLGLSGRNVKLILLIKLGIAKNRRKIFQECKAVTVASFYTVQYSINLVYVPKALKGVVCISNGNINQANSGMIILAEVTRIP